MLLIVLSTLGGLARVRALILKGWPAQAGLRSVPDPDNHQSTGALSQSHFWVADNWEKKAQAEGFKVYTLTVQDKEQARPRSLKYLKESISLTDN